MRWILAICVIIATLSVAQSKPTSRKNWFHIKNVIAKGLFGRNTAVIIHQPEIPDNKNYQLFKIDGYEDVVINLTRRDDIQKKLQKPVDVKVPLKTDPVIDGPEMEIITKYIGAANQKEALQALEALQSLLKSGILSGEGTDLTQEDDTEQEKYTNYNTPKLKPIKVFVEENTPNIDIRFGQIEDTNDGIHNADANKTSTTDTISINNHKNHTESGDHIPHEFIFVPPSNEFQSNVTPTKKPKQSTKKGEKGASSSKSLRKKNNNKDRKIN